MRFLFAIGCLLILPLVAFTQANFNWSVGFNSTTIPANTVELFVERKFHKNFSIVSYTGFTAGWSNRDIPNLHEENLSGYFIRPGIRMVTYTEEKKLEFYFMELTLGLSSYRHEAYIEVEHFYGTMRDDFDIHGFGAGAAYTTGFIKNFGNRVAVESGFSLRFFPERKDGLSHIAYQVPGIGRFKRSSISVSFPVVVKFRIHASKKPDEVF